MKLIESISELTLKQFEQCLFKDNYSVLIIEGEASENELKSAWISLYTEYIDLSGLAATTELDLMRTIFYLDSRVRMIALLLHIQRESLDKIGVPCIGAFDKMRVYGHSLVWDKANPNLEWFNKQLLAIENNEKKYQIQCDGKIKELLELKKKQSKGQVTVLQKRKEFIRTINALTKHGYKIDRDKTSVEEFALMLCDYNDIIEAESFKNSN
jgi:hypothetical protein